MYLSLIWTGQPSVPVHLWSNLSKKKKKTRGNQVDYLSSSYMYLTLSSIVKQHPQYFLLIRANHICQNSNFSFYMLLPDIRSLKNPGRSYSLQFDGTHVLWPLRMSLLLTLQSRSIRDEIIIIIIITIKAKKKTPKNPKHQTDEIKTTSRSQF